jgi:hypothetical protein
VDVENVADKSDDKLKPAIVAPVAGETPMSPVMTDVGTVEMPVFARIAKSPAVPRLTAVTTSSR